MTKAVQNPPGSISGPGESSPSTPSLTTKGVRDMPYLFHMNFRLTRDLKHVLGTRLEQREWYAVRNIITHSTKPRC